MKLKQKNIQKNISANDVLRSREFQRALTLNVLAARFENLGQEIEPEQVKQIVKSILKDKSLANSICDIVFQNIN